MQLLLVVELALMLVLVVKMQIRNVERELRRKFARFDDTN
jgi:hypothetical protein